MISILKGKVAEKSPGFVVIETAGVGYGVAVSLKNFEKIPAEGREAKLRIYTHVSLNSRESSIELFGFLTRYEEDIFRKLVGVPGIGPRAAIRILSNMTAEDLAESIARGDLHKRKVPGIGNKTAIKIMNELKDKVAKPEFEISPEAAAMIENIVSALRNYGFKNSEIEASKKEIDRIAKSSDDIETAIKKALSAVKN